MYSFADRLIKGYYIELKKNVRLLRRKVKHRIKHSVKHPDEKSDELGERIGLILNDMLSLSQSIEELIVHIDKNANAKYLSVEDKKRIEEDNNAKQLLLYLINNLSEKKNLKLSHS